MVPSEAIASGTRSASAWSTAGLGSGLLEARGGARERAAGSAGGRGGVVAGVAPAAGHQQDPGEGGGEEGCPTERISREHSGHLLRRGRSSILLLRPPLWWPSALALVSAGLPGRDEERPARKGVLPQSAGSSAQSGPLTSP